VIEAGTPPEKILSLLGIIEPEDIDIEAIAFACGATILKEPLTGCEANIIGSGDKAVITRCQQGARPSFFAGVK